MEENKSLWSKTSDELTAGEQLKVAAIAPIVSMAVIFVPLWAAGKLIARRIERKQKPALAIVEDTTEE